MCITRIGLVVALILSAYSVARAQEVWVESGTSFAPTLGYDPGFVLKTRVVFGGLKGSTLEVEGWLDMSDKWVGQGWSLDERTKFSWLNVDGLGPMIGIGFWKFGGPWDKKVMWYLVGVEKRSTSYDLSVNYRGEVASTANNHQSAVDTSMRAFFKDRFSLETKVGAVHFYDEYPTTRGRWGFSTTFLVGVLFSRHSLP